MKCFSFVIHHLFQISGHDHKKTAFFVEYLGLFFLNLVANGAAAVICSKAVMIQWVFKPLQSKTFNRFTGCEKRNIFSELTVFSNNIAIFHKTDVILSICQDHIDTLLSAISQKSHVSNKMIQSSTSCAKNKNILCPSSYCQI